MGGVGKTLLAAALSSDSDIIKRFPNGIYWITIGKKSDLLSLQNSLIGMLGCSIGTATTIQKAKDFISRLLSEKSYLLVLDDVWKIEDAQAFSVANNISTILITTRDRRILKRLDVPDFKVQMLSPVKALELLARRTRLNEKDLPLEANEIVKECGYLPLAIAIIGSMLRNNISKRWEDVLNGLKN